MLPIAFLLDGPPRYQLFEQQILLCVYVPLFATLLIRVLLLQYPEYGRVAALVVALIAAAAIILPSYRYVRFGHPYGASLPVLVAPWISALVPFGAASVFLRRQRDAAKETVSELRTFLSHSAAVVVSVVCFAITLELADTLNDTRSHGYRPDYFAPAALMRATVLFAICEAARQFLLRTWSVLRAAGAGALLAIALANVYVKALDSMSALGAVIMLLAVYATNVVFSGRAAIRTA